VTTQEPTPFLQQLIVSLRASGASFILGSNLAQTPNTDLFFFRYEAGTSRAKRPIAVCIAHAADPKERMERFLTMPLRRSRYGLPARLAITIDDTTATEDLTKDLLAFLATEHAASDTSTFTVRHTNGAWTDETRPSNPLPTSTQREEARREDRRAGIVAESLLVRDLRRLGCSLTQDSFIDEDLKTDFVITACAGVRLERRIAGQLTKRFDDLYKLDTYLRRSKGIRDVASRAQRLYIQYAEGVTTAELAFAIMGHAVSVRAKKVEVDVVFLEIDDRGAREFNIQTRLQELIRRADPQLSAKERVRGTVQEIVGSRMTIIAEGGKRYAAFISAIVDRDLNRAFREQQRGEMPVDLRNTRVSFVPGQQPTQRYLDPHALSVLLDEP
jgi:hypothetical protein